MKPGSKATFKRQQYTYFVTISPIRKKDYVTKEELDDAYDTLLSKLYGIPTILKKVYELDNKYFSLHIHFILKVPYALKYTKLSKIGACSLYFKKAYNLNQLVDYMTKQVPNEYEQDNLIVSHTFCHKKAPSYFK